MEDCNSFNVLDCDCTYSALSAPNLVMTEVDNNFLFRGLVAGTNVEISQTPSEIVISTIIPDQPRALVVADNISSTTRLTLPGFVYQNVIINTGLYSAGVVTIPVTGIYATSAQYTTTSTILDTAEFVRNIIIIVNGITQVADSVITTFSNANKTINCSIDYPFTVGDLVTVNLIIGSNTSSTPFQVIDNFFSIKLIS